MKTYVISIMLVAIQFTTTQCITQSAISYDDTPQDSVIVKAQSNDISNNLDLQAVASEFGDAKNLEDFEKRLNDADSKISNLDLNKDGEVDYLRVVEKLENGAHIITIQAVLSKDVFQDVATIVVEKKGENRTVVQIIGDPYLYGSNYIVEPVYTYPPLIYSYLWGDLYAPWISPYYWGYYPPFFHVRPPFSVFAYLSYIHPRVNHLHKYYYNDRIRYRNFESTHNAIRRNDFGSRDPQHSFSNRAPKSMNKQSFRTYRYYPGTSYFHQPQFRSGSGRVSGGGRSSGGNRR